MLKPLCKRWFEKHDSNCKGRSVKLEAFTMCLPRMFLDNWGNLNLDITFAHIEPMLNFGAYDIGIVVMWRVFLFLLLTSILKYLQI